MNILRNAVLILLLTLCGNSAIAAERPTRFEKPEDVVAWLYRDFGWEAYIFHYFDDILIDQPKHILERYFTPRLADLIVKDRQYEIKTKELGHIDFMILFFSQDPAGISNIRIKRMSGSNKVSVLYDYNQEKDVVEIVYETVQTKSGWHISDVHYKTRASNAFPAPVIEGSLLKELSQPY